MQYWPYILAAALLMGLLLIRSRILRRRSRIAREFARKLETVLQPKETVKVVCAAGKHHWIATSRRLLIETAEGFQAWPYGKIKQVKGVDSTGKNTVSAAKMATLTIKTDREYTLHGKGEDFTLLARELMSKTRKKK